MAVIVPIEYRISGIDEINDAIKRIEVLEQANKDLEEQLKDLQDQEKNTKKETDELGDAALDAAKQINIFGVNVVDAGKKLGAATKSTKAFGVALKALPLVAVAAALASVATFLTSTERGQEKLRIATAKSNAVLSVFRDRISRVGESLVNAASAAANSESAFAKILRLTLKLNPVLLGFNANLELLKRAFPGLTKEINDEAAAAAELERQLIQLEKIERGFAVQRAEANVEIERSKLLAEDVSQAIEVRIANAQRALSLENEILQKEQSAARIRVSILEDQIRLGESVEENFVELEQARIAAFNIEQQSLTKQIELNNKLNTLLTEQNKQYQAKFDLLNDIEEITDRQSLSGIEASQDELDDIIKNADARQKASLDAEAASVRLAQGDEQRRREREEATLQSLGVIGNETLALFGDRAQAAKAGAIFEATINTIQAITKALTAGPILGPILAATIGALGFAQVNRISAQPVPEFEEGVINIGGKRHSQGGIPAIIEQGESVMTRKETQNFLPTLKAIRKGDIDAELLNGISSGKTEIRDHSKIVQVPYSNVNIDENGFTERIYKKGVSITKKQNRYSTKLFS